MTLANYAVANANAPVAISPGISAPAGPKFPDLLGPGAPVRARDFEAQGNALHRNIAIAVWGIAMLGLVVGTMGAFLGLLILGWLIAHVMRKRIQAQIKGTCLEVGPNQLPEIYACTKAFAERLGLKEVPHIYIAEGNTANAAAVRLGSRNIVFLIDDIVWGALKAGDPNALSFIIAHELAHHALGHTSSLQLYLSTIYKPLSRLNELSCDAVALQLVGSREAAYNGIIMLMVGPQLVPYVNRAALFAQAEQVGQDKMTKKAEKVHSHPFVARRLWELRNVGMGR
ncbi:MAG: M48 family metallopeptidase [Myxococcales bacterium]